MLIDEFISILSKIKEERGNLPIQITDGIYVYFLNKHDIKVVDAVVELGHNTYGCF